MKRQKIYRYCSVCILIMMLICGCSGREGIKVLKLAHVLEPSHPVHRGMEYLAQKLEELSEGKMRMNIYPSGQLGTGEREYIESLQIGSLDLTNVSSAVLENFVPLSLSPLFAVYITPIVIALVTGFSIGLGFYWAKRYFENNK